MTTKQERILIVDDEKILKVVRHHHERYDSTGYPDELKCESIPLGTRILAIADTYDAMTEKDALGLCHPVAISI